MGTVTGMDMDMDMDTVTGLMKNSFNVEFLKFIFQTKNMVIL